MERLREQRSRLSGLPSPYNGTGGKGAVPVREIARPSPLCRYKGRACPRPKMAPQADSAVAVEQTGSTGLTGAIATCSPWRCLRQEPLPTHLAPLAQPIALPVRYPTEALSLY